MKNIVYVKWRKGMSRHKEDRAWECQRAFEAEPLAKWLNELGLPAKVITNAEYIALPDYEDYD